MIKLVAIAFALVLATSAQAMPVAPLQPDGLMTQVAFACGPRRTRVAGVCVEPPSVMSVGVCDGMEAFAFGIIDPFAAASGPPF